MIKRANPVDSVVLQIYDASAGRALSRRQVADLAGVHVNTLKRFGKPDWNPAFSTFHKIAAVLLTEEHPSPPLDQDQQVTREAVREHRNVVPVKPKSKH